MDNKDFPAEVRDELDKAKKNDFEVVKISTIHSTNEENYHVYTLIIRTFAGYEISEISYRNDKLVRKASVYLTDDLVQEIVNHWNKEAF